MVPNLAASATQNDDGTWTVELAPGRFFSDGTPVTAEPVAVALNRTGEANPSARATAGRLGFTAVDDDTLTVRTGHSTAILPSIRACRFGTVLFHGMLDRGSSLLSPRRS